MPVRIFTIVDLPAPFSPISAVTSPALSPKVTSFKARTPGKLLETPIRDRTGVPPSVVKSADMAKVNGAGKNGIANTHAYNRQCPDHAGRQGIKGRSAPFESADRFGSEDFGEFLDI